MTGDLTQGTNQEREIPHPLFATVMSRTVNFCRPISIFKTADGIRLQVTADNYHEFSVCIEVSTRRESVLNCQELFWLYQDGRVAVEFSADLESATGLAIHKVTAQRQECSPEEIKTRSNLWLTRQLDKLNKWLAAENTSRVAPYAEDTKLPDEDVQEDDVLNDFLKMAFGSLERFRGGDDRLDQPRNVDLLDGGNQSTGL